MSKSITNSQMKEGYKQAEVGIIPEDWESTTLGKFVLLQRGHDLTQHERRQGDIPVMGSAGQNGFHDTALVKGSGVVLGRSGASFGQAHYCEQDFWPHNTALYVTDFLENDRLYTFYFLKSLDFSRHNSGGAQQSLNRNFIAPIPIAVPPIHEQKAIAHALSDIDALIESLDRLLTKKRQIKQGAMQELLRSKDGWEKKYIGDVLTISHGRSQHEVIDENGAYPILASGGEIGRAKKYLYNKPSVLIGRKGTIDKPQYMDQPFWTVDTLFYSVIHEPNNAKYIFYQFCLIPWREYNEASGVPSLNARTIHSIEITLPLPEEQIEIATILSDMDAEIDSIEAKLTKTRQIKQGMMHELLTGRIRLI